ncbi:Peptidyl-prolyl cis-trans isomerase A [Diplonema papillatum]|nr:Peptidyl-prolyl cis-trans isomerase A [Diplonema papillatum]
MAARFLLWCGISVRLCAAAAGDLAYVRCGSTAGDFAVEVHPEWSPLGAERYLRLVDDGFFDGSGLFRVVKGFLAQFGLPAAPGPKWAKYPRITDDPKPGISFRRGMVSFAGSGKDSRTTQVFISYKNSRSLGNSPWETPVGLVVQGMGNVDRWYSGYGDLKSLQRAKGKDAGVDPGEVKKRGNAYLEESFPLLSFLGNCSRVPRDTVVFDAVALVADGALLQHSRRADEDVGVHPKSNSTLYSPYIMLCTVVVSLWVLVKNRGKSRKVF